MLIAYLKQEPGLIKITTHDPHNYFALWWRIHREIISYLHPLPDSIVLENEVTYKVFIDAIKVERILNSNLVPAHVLDPGYTNPELKVTGLVISQMEEHEMQSPVGRSRYGYMSPDPWEGHDDLRGRSYNHTAVFGNSDSTNWATISSATWATTDSTE